MSIRDAVMAEFDRYAEQQGYTQTFLALRGTVDTLLSHPPEPSEDPAGLRQAKDAAYAERDKLVSALSKVFPSHLCRHPVTDETWENDWRWIVCIHAPTGQMTWHIHDSELPQFSHLEKLDNHWDGHDTAEKYRRLADLARSPVPELAAEGGLIPAQVEAFKAGAKWAQEDENRYSDASEIAALNLYNGGNRLHPETPKETT